MCMFVYTNKYILVYTVSVYEFYLYVCVCVGVCACIADSCHVPFARRPLGLADAARYPLSELRTYAVVMMVVKQQVVVVVVAAR